VRKTLAGLVAARDAARFVGRAAELARLESLLAHDPPVNVVLLNGPGGVGKSALMRELARRAAARAVTLVEVEARGLAPLAEELDRALAPAMTAERPLVLLDSWERLAALDGHLRRHLLPRLPADALVVVASRHAPGRSWFSAGWDHVVLDLPLSPLDAEDADSLLAVRGVQPPSPGRGARRWRWCSPPTRRSTYRMGPTPRRPRRWSTRCCGACSIPSPTATVARSSPSPRWHV
jgi:hypothetical protein